MDQQLIEFFQEALAEEGLVDVKVEHHRKATRQSTVLTVRKAVDGEFIGIDHNISDQKMGETVLMQKHLARLARDTARKFKQYSTEKYTWGEKCVAVDLSQEYNATCYRCGAEVEMDELERMAVPLAETAVPQPVTRDYRSLSKTKLKMTLLALLRNKCEPYCPNSTERQNS